MTGDSQALLRKMKGFHWMTCYDNYLRETAYALKKLKVDLRQAAWDFTPGAIVQRSWSVTASVQ